MNEPSSESSRETPSNQDRPEPSQPARQPASIAVARALPYTETDHLQRFAQQQTYAVPTSNQQIGGNRNTITDGVPPLTHSHTNREPTTNTALTRQRDSSQRFPVPDNSSKSSYRLSLDPTIDQSGVSLSFRSDPTNDSGTGSFDAYRVHHNAAQTGQHEYQYHQSQSAFSDHTTRKMYPMSSSSTYAPAPPIPDIPNRHPVTSAIVSWQDGMMSGWTQPTTEQKPSAQRGGGQNTTGDTGQYHQDGPFWTTAMTTEGEQQGQAGPSNSYNVPGTASRFTQTFQGYPQGHVQFGMAEGYPSHPVPSTTSPGDMDGPAMPTWSSPLASGQQPPANQQYSSVPSSSAGVTTSSNPSEVSYQSVFPAQRILVDGEEEADRGVGETRKDKRRAQNRVAQRAFRARSRVQNQEAVDRMDQLEQLVKKQSEQLRQSSIDIQRLTSENAILRSGYTGPLPPGIENFQAESLHLPDGFEVRPDGRIDRQPDGVDVTGAMKGEAEGVDGYDSGMPDGWEESIGAWRER